MSVADYVFTELDPDAPDFAERFRGARPALEVALHYLGIEDYSLPRSEQRLWMGISCGLACIRDGSTGHVEAARSYLRAIRQLRDYERLDHAMTTAACELSRLRRRLIEAQSVEPVPEPGDPTQRAAVVSADDWGRLPENLVKPWGMWLRVGDVEDAIGAEFGGAPPCLDEAEGGGERPACPKCGQPMRDLPSDTQLCRFCFHPVDGQTEVRNA